MSKKDRLSHRARYALEFKPEAARLVKAGQEVSATARVLMTARLQRLTLSVASNRAFGSRAALETLTILPGTARICASP